ncbi:MAG: hypothetical protein ACJ8C4_00535 [Gemmataceae bacterium]
MPPYPKLACTPPSWSLTSDLKIVAIEPFDGAFTYLPATPNGIVIADLAVSLPQPFSNDQIREIRANAHLMLGAWELFILCRSAHQALAGAEYYGARRGELVRRLETAMRLCVPPGVDDGKGT